MTSLPRPTLNPPALAAPVAPSTLRRTLPNWLTASRVVMAFVFFGVLTAWRYDDSAASQGQTDGLLLLAAALFGVAVATDALDGYLARRWHTESAFGRIMDPFADKILVIGALVFLASPDFWYPFPDHHAARLTGHGIQVSGLYPWMAVLMVARELLVTSIRAVLESAGHKFYSDWWGKGKMILQSFAIPAILVIIATCDVRSSAPVLSATPAPGGGGIAGIAAVMQSYWSNPPGRIAVDGLVWITLLVTVISGVPYVRRCLAMLAEWREEKREERRAP